MVAEHETAPGEATQRITRLTPLDSVLARIDALVAPVAPREVALAAAAARILADDLILPVRPAAALALRDGFAVSAQATEDAGAYAPVALPQAQRIDAGAAMPAQCDAVVPVDAVMMRGGVVEVLVPVTAGDGVLLAGGDADGRRVTLQAGRALQPLAMAALAAAQVARVRVREPRLHVLCTRPDAILDAAARWVARTIAAHGGVALIEPGDRLEDVLRREDADALVAIGGTGSGRDDRSVATLARVGAVEAHGVALAPGETAAFGRIGQRPVLLLPGRLDAAVAVWTVIGHRLLMRLAASRAETPGAAGRLTRKVASNLGLAEIVPVRWRGEEVEPLGAGYLSLQTLVQADGWILVGAGHEGYRAGASVVVKTWP